MEIFVRDIHLNLIGSSLSKGPPLLAVKVEEVVIYNTYELMFSQIDVEKKKRKKNDGLFHFEIKWLEERIPGYQTKITKDYHWVWAEGDFPIWTDEFGYLVEDRREL